MAIGTKGLSPADLDQMDDERLAQEPGEGEGRACSTCGSPPPPARLENHGRLKAVRRDIARIYTIVREREARHPHGAEHRGVSPVSENTAAQDAGAAGTAPAAVVPARNNRKVRQGYVVSDKMDKTVVVEPGGPRQARPVRQGHPAHRPGEGARRGQHGRRRRPGPRHGDPAAVRHQAAPPGGDPPEGQVKPGRPPPAARPAGRP